MADPEHARRGSAEAGSERLQGAPRIPAGAVGERQGAIREMVELGLRPTGPDGARAWQRAGKRRWAAGGERGSGGRG
eukprot:6568748-Pyramimonas_sp.AAC.1